MPHAPLTRGRQRRPEGLRWTVALLALPLIAILAAACSGPEPATTATSTPRATAAVTAGARQTGTTTRATTSTPTRPAAGTATRTVTGTTTRATGTVRTATGTATPGAVTRAGLGGENIRVVAAGPADGRLVYAGGRGVWRSTDGGGQWTRVLGETEAPRVSAIAVAPSNAQVVYVGVGEGCARGTTRSGFVSLDGGATWRQTGRNIAGFAVDPRNAQVVYAVSCQGVERSADAGASWEGLGGARVENYDPVLIAIAPADPQTLYVAYASEGGTVRVRRSSDGGTSWQDADPPGPPTGPLALATDAADARDVFLSTTMGLYRSEDGGRSWELLTAGLEATAGVSGAPPGTRSNTALAAGPEQPGVLWLGTGTTRAPGSGIYRTRDGGNSWRLLTGFEGRPVQGLAPGGRGDGAVLYIATDDGVWRLDAAATPLCHTILRGVSQRFTRSTGGRTGPDAAIRAPAGPPSPSRPRRRGRTANASSWHADCGTRTRLCSRPEH